MENKNQCAIISFDLCRYICLEPGETAQVDYPWSFSMVPKNP